MTRHKLKSNILHLIMALSFAMLFGFAPSALATSCATNPDLQSCSATYGVGESFFGSGGLDYCDPDLIAKNHALGIDRTYCSKTSAGELTVGNTKGTAYQAQAGFNTDRQPYLEVNITKAAVDLGVISPSTTGHDTAVFAVKSYLASGYQVQIYGTSPTNNGHAVTAIASPYTSSPGTEQFGLNLAVNTTPALGAAPVQDKDSSGGGTAFGFGAAATTPVDYHTANQFHYTSGDTIASSSQSSGWTTYTISYIMNVSAITPGGTYTAYQSIVATSTF